MPNKDFIKEMTWRGMIQDVMPGTEEQLNKEMTVGYIGFDPTADSLHIGNLVPIMLLMHFQRCGHKPIALVGGATGMIGDPSGKSEERTFLDEDTINHNLNCQKKQLQQFLTFGEEGNGAIMVNNYDWFKNIGFLEFLREAGKHITVNYMMAKESVKKRLETGISFTEFSYQLVQGFDFYHLYKNFNCKLQMGGSDQWGNIVTGTEFIRRKDGGEAFAMTAPLITKADGSKFGKSEGGNVWLDPERTSPYHFYQYWINCADEDASRYIRIFTLLEEEDIKEIENRHKEAPHLRELQKELAAEVTKMVHSEDDLKNAVEASQLLFGKGTTESLKKLDGKTILSVFDGVPQSDISKDEINSGIPIVELLVDKTGIFPSNGEARRMLKGNGISVNKEKVDENFVAGSNDILDDRFILVQKGKKNYFLVNIK